VCTLPSAERPLRAAEFDSLFACAASGLDRLDATHARLHLRGENDLEARVRDLASRESACCSFFTFEVSASRADVTLDVRVDAAHAHVLDALVRRYQQRTPGR
jgi:hypothetical protein